MFNILIANAAFSPSMLTTVGFYARRLKQEEFTRKLGMIFSACAVVLQSTIILSPPEPAIAAGPNNIIYSGVTSVSDLLNKYDNNNDGNGHKDLQQIFNHYGISREDLAQAKLVTIKSTDRDKQLRSIGRKAYGKTGEAAVPISNSGTTVYERYLWSWDSGSYSTYQAIQGTTADGRWFAVLMNCGNLVIDEPPPAPKNPVGSVEATCEAITGWAYDPNNLSKFISVRITLKLEDDTSSPYSKTVKANLSTPASPVSGNHGYRVDIPQSKKSHDKKTVYTVVALESVGGGQDKTLAQGQKISTFCEEPPSPDPLLQFCDISTGNIVTIKESQRDENIHKSSNQCDEVTICLKDKLVTIQEFERDNEPYDCPVTQVCREGVVISIRTNEKRDTDLNSNQCDDIEVCRDGELITIQKFEAKNEDEPPDPTLLCEEPVAVFAYSKTAKNLTQNILDANGTRAQPGDVIEYELIAENIGNTSGKVEFSEDLSDVLEYATLSDTDGGQLDQTSKVLSWNDAIIDPNSQASHKFTVTILTEIPASPSPTNNLESNNLELRNVWNDNTVVINVPSPITKTPEVLASSLPNTGPGTNIAVSAGLIVLTTYFYLRNRQLSREIKVFTKLNTGGMV